jgi:hypothetical protein
VLGYVQEPTLDESSGLVASRRNPGLYWSHNDSDDAPDLYCLRGHGESCGVWRVAAAEARDWEDIAAGPGPESARTYLYIGDIGDNLVELDEVVVYRVAEPEVPPGGGPEKAAPAPTEPAQRLRLRYPDGAHDTEALLVHPRSGDLYVIPKEPMPKVYVARAPLDPSSVNGLEEVGVLAIAETGDRGAGLVTGGDISPDGQRVALCTYLGGFELDVAAPDAGGFDAVWKKTPAPVAVGSRLQGEAIAYRLDGKALLTTSERAAGLPAPLQQVERQ